MRNQAPEFNQSVREYRYRMCLKMGWFRKAAGENGNLPDFSNKTQDLSIIVSDQYVISKVGTHSTSIDLLTGNVTVYDHKKGLKKGIPCTKPKETTGNVDDWKSCDLGQKVLLNNHCCSIKYSLTTTKVASNALQKIWQVLVPGIPQKHLPKGLPATMSLQNQAGETVLDLTLIDDEATDHSHLNSLKKYKPTAKNPVNPFKGIKPKPIKTNKNVDHLRNLSRRYRRRHTARGQAVDAAWILKQPVLDQIKDLVNTLSREIVNFQNPDDGSLGIHFKLWPILESILARGDYTQVPHYSDWSTMSDLLFRAMTLIEVYYGRMPVLANRSPGGLRRGEVQRHLNWLAQTLANGVYDDKSERTLSYFFASPPVTQYTRMKQIGEAQLAYMLDNKVVAKDDNGLPLRSYSGRLPDTDDETRLMRFEFKNFQFSLNINRREILDRLEFVDDHVELDFEIPNITFGADFSTNALASVLSVSLTFLTGGAWAMWMDNQGHWSASVNAKVAFDLIPDVVDSATGEKLEMAVVFNNDRSDFSWRAEPFFTENPFNAEIIWLIVLMAERVFDWTGEWDDDLMNAVAEALDEFFREALRWPDVWSAVSGPLTSTVAPHFDDDPGVGVWKSSVVPDGFRVPSGVATNVDPEKADPLAFAVSERYIVSWLQNRLRVEHGEFPFNTPLSPDEVASEIGGVLPTPESLESDSPDYEEPDFDPFMNVGNVRCPDPPSPPLPETRYEAVMVRSEPRISLPRAERASYVADFEMDYWARVIAVRTWQIPVIVGAGYDCLPVPGLDSGVDFGGIPPLSPAAIFNGIDREVFDFAGIEFDKFISRFSDLQAKAGFGSALPELPPGLPPTPSPPGQNLGQLPDQQSRSCTIDCSWAYEAERRNIGTFLQIHAKISGKLLLDFDPNFYGQNSEGILEGPIPGLRLSILGDEADVANLEVEIDPVQLSGPFADLSTSRISELFANKFKDNAHAIFDGLVYDDAPVTKMAIVPRSKAVSVLPLDFLVDVIDWARSIVAYEQAFEGEGLEYLVDGNMVYWPVVLKEGIRSFMGEE